MSAYVSEITALRLRVVADAMFIDPVAMRYMIVLPVIEMYETDLHYLSVRSTNVYEEKSLGVFDDDEESVDDEFTPTGNRVTVWSSYLAMHMRKQLSFGMTHCLLHVGPS